MSSLRVQALVVVAVSGSAFAMAEPVELEPSVGEVRHAGHIYFNVTTGEKITTLIGVGDAQQPVAGEPGSEIWIADTGNPCADFGYSTSMFFDLDNPSGTTSLSVNAMLVDWGDIAFNTVVDCVQIHWLANHADTDTDSDSLADGVEGLAATWTYWDGVNGSAPNYVCLVAPVISFSFFNLPGEFPVDTATIPLWTADIDLAGSFGTSLTFELGDDDSDLQGASVHNPRRDLDDQDSDSIPDIDPDQDGLADWGWSIQFVQPGVADVDNADSDSDWQTGIDGDIAALSTAGILFGSPTPGHAEYDSIADEWNWISDGPTAGATEDAFVLGVTENPDGTGQLAFAGTFDFGGLNCSGGQSAYVPAAHFQTVLYGDVITEPCIGLVDLGGNPDGSPDGRLNFLDVSAFLSLYANHDPSADFAGGQFGNPDGAFNFLDVSAFLMMYADALANCP